METSLALHFGPSTFFDTVDKNLAHAGDVAFQNVFVLPVSVGIALHHLDNLDCVFCECQNHDFDHSKNGP